jgi:hypothetical protein
MSSKTQFFFRLKFSQIEATVCRITVKPEVHRYGPAAKGYCRALVEVEAYRGVSGCSFHWRAQGT